MKKFYFILLILAAATSLQAQNGYTTLFDGKTLNGWKRIVGSGEYTVKNNMIVGTTVAGSPNTFLATDKEYSDFIIEFDAKVDDTASNSGVQIRSHFDPDALMICGSPAANPKVSGSHTSSFSTPNSARKNRLPCTKVLYRRVSTLY